MMKTSIQSIFFHHIIERKVQNFKEKYNVANKRYQLEQNPEEG